MLGKCLSLPLLINCGKKDCDTNCGWYWYSKEVCVTHFGMWKWLLRLVNLGFLSITQPMYKYIGIYIPQYTSILMDMGTTRQRCLRRRVSSWQQERWSRRERGSDWLSQEMPLGTPTGHTELPKWELDGGISSMIETCYEREGGVLCNLQ